MAAWMPAVESVSPLGSAPESAASKTSGDAALPGSPSPLW